ncbi:helix-turn-helix domain-containing protein [Variovorax paradoxus]|uniref:Helix-turn-helix domain-containing protein n=1 Tax=Variovorax paradoxus TaxID=34073 RepID=A0A6I6H7A4_VARPD|nr:helix-turn-helix domain-containing protein [Variovorax paradoxus]QGW82822.1 helix-turn-helix domain-containing protein [Variovorax paradoxus]
MPAPPSHERLYVRLDEDPLHGPEAAMPVGSLQAFPVAAPLRAHVAHILLYREALPDGREVLERVLPDGAVRLVFNLGDAPSAGEGAGQPVEAIGASAAPALVRLRGRVEGLSVTLRPGASAALLGMPAGEIAGTAVHLDQLWRGQGAELRERMAAAPDDSSRVAVLCAMLGQRLARADAALHPAAPMAATRAAQLIAESGGRQSLRDVAAAVGVGERRLQQLFQQQVGLSPRTWGRLARLHACLRALRQPRPCMPGWAELALDGGFYDQSHLVNEFKALSGLTPTEFLGRAISVSSNTAA